MLNSIKITDITKTKKGFNALFCDNGFLFSVDDLMLIQEKIEIGSCFTQQELTLLYGKSSTNKAVQKAYNLLSYRSHSRKELQDKLCKNFDSECASAACDKMEELGLINDEEYCKANGRKPIKNKGTNGFSNLIKQYLPKVINRNGNFVVVGIKQSAYYLNEVVRG